MCSVIIRKTPSVRVCKKTKTTRSRCGMKPLEGREWDCTLSADHKILKVENESRRGHKKRSNRAR